MPLEMQDSFRNRKLEVFCLKYFRLCERERERERQGLCADKKRTCVDTPRQALGSRAGSGLAWPSRLLSSTKAHLFGIAIFLESQNQGSFLLLLLPHQGKLLCAMLGKVNTCILISAAPPVSELFPPPRWKEGHGPL